MVLRLRIPPPDRWRDAKCLGVAWTGDDPWFEDMPEALEFCNGTADGVICPAREGCLLFALTNNLKEGVWGGASELTRKALRKRWPLTSRVPRPEWHWMTEEDALRGVRLADLLAEEDDDDEDEDDFP
jgi:hypothetical protein